VSRRLLGKWRMLIFETLATVGFQEGNLVDEATLPRYSGSFILRSNVL